LATLHICIDEAGDFGFKPSGSKYLIFTAAWTYSPAALAASLSELRFALMKEGHDLKAFHCSEDKQHHRDAVVTRMLHDADWHFASVVVEKRKINPALYGPDRFYLKFVTPLLRFVLRGCVEPGTDRLVICTDTIPVKNKRDAITKALKQTCAAELPAATTRLYSHPRESNKWIQVADYCAWAVQRKWERSDTRTYAQLRHRMIKEELDICAHGDQTLYY
jgi:hypothetical protein